MDHRMILKRKRSERIDTPSDRSAELHVKNPYKHKPPNFADLASRHPDILSSFVTVNPISGKGRIDFTDPAAARALTQSMLLSDFGVTVDIPADHLCPPLPNRINYLCWISDLIDSVAADAPTTSRATCDVSVAGVANTHTVLDIGVGPVCIYPLLGHALYKWDFVGTDIDASSVQYSQLNLTHNEEASKHIQVYHVDDCSELQTRIVQENLPTITPTTSEAYSQSKSLLDACAISEGNSAPLRGPILQALASRDAGSASSSNAVRNNSLTDPVTSMVFSAVMTNPPFYDTDEQVQPSEHTVCNGSTSEMRTLGGEVAFVAAIIADSLALRDRVLWYTSMVGKRSSLKQIKRILVHEGVHKDHIFTTTLAQGLTHRWAIAWTFHSAAASAYRLSCDAKQGTYINGGVCTSSRAQQLSPTAVAATNTRPADCVYASTVSVPSLLNTMLPEDDIIVTSQPNLAQHLQSLCAQSETSTTDELPLKAISRVLSAVHHSCTVVTTPSALTADLQYEYMLDNLQAHIDGTGTPAGYTITFTVHQSSNAVGSVTYNVTIHSGACSTVGEGLVTVNTLISVLPGHHHVLSKEYCNKQHELFDSNLMRTNRKWRRTLQQAATNAVPANCST